MNIIDKQVRMKRLNINFKMKFSHQINTLLIYSDIETLFNHDAAIFIYYIIHINCS